MGEKDANRRTHDFPARARGGAVRVLSPRWAVVLSPREQSEAVHRFEEGRLLIGATHDTRYRHGWPWHGPITGLGPCLTNALVLSGLAPSLGNHPYIRSYRNGTVYITPYAVSTVQYQIPTRLDVAQFHPVGSLIQTLSHT